MKILPHMRMLLMLTVFTACQKDPNVLHIQNLNGNEISIYGHGGMGIYYPFPTNSLKSIERCLDIGADGVEIDVQLTKDGQLIIYHDPDLSDQTDCSGTVNDKNWGEIESCKYKVPVLSNQGILSLDRLFQAIADIHAFTYTFDCKLFYNGSDFEGFINDYTDALIALIDRYGIADNVFIESASPDFLNTLQAKKSNYKLFHLAYQSFEQGLSMAKQLDLYGISLANDKVTAEQVAIAHEEGFYITIWNTKTPKQNIEAIKKSPDYIQTDKLPYLLKAFEKHR